ncbi:inositol polyphosphate 5-phosphatase K-like [Melitaea cinxia]|uniref:inositol polyphosphate 5-phosphatase K-like n=1 Tax=Melitaea cinxia TaxID=113334 RepID=UPI001E26ED4C|nr:inositol polyphosphate 5-phosphatase K-like [Melitaea cinxia]
MDTLRFYFVTWNVATRSPGQDLNSLLDFPSQFNKNKPLPDFYVIGLQEVKSQPQNMLMDSLFTDQWTSMFNKILCRQGFVVAKSIRLQGIILIVYTKLKHVTHLRDIEAQFTKTGLGGLWGNKGAVSVRFNIYGCSVCLVNCHLAAHDYMLEERISEYNTIIKEHCYHIAETSNILYHDYVFWVGDLNFRLDHPSDSSPSSEEIVAALEKVEKDKYTSLLKHDQLLAVMNSGEAFSEFSEPEIKFPPTYKFNIGTDDYDLKRKPSWTDRILYKVIANNYENITLRADLISYNHMPHYMVSDHKPVVAQFNIKIRSAVPVEVPKIKKTQIRMRSALIPPEGDASMVEPIAAFSALDDNIGIDSTEQEEEFSVSFQAFSNYTVKTVEFDPIVRIWYIGDADFRTQCTLSPDVEIHPNDWIGIYDADFQNLDNYIVYEYLAKVSVAPTAAPGTLRKVTLSFPVGSGVRTPGFYRLIYFSQPNSEVKSVLGISEPFEVSSKEDRLVTIDPCVEASTSSSPGRSKPSTATTDIFTDFTGLDVAKLSRHFSNDLSID